MDNYSESFIVDDREERAPAIHIPCVVGTEMYVLTQQDKRCWRDIRQLTYTRWVPNEQMLPWGPASQDPGNVFSFPIMNTCPEPGPSEHGNRTDRSECSERSGLGDPESPPIVKKLDIAQYCKDFYPIQCDIANVVCESRESEPEGSPKVDQESIGTTTTKLMVSIGCQHGPRFGTTNKGCQTTDSLIGVSSRRPRNP